MAQFTIIYSELIKRYYHVCRYQFTLSSHMQVFIILSCNAIISVNGINAIISVNGIAKHCNNEHILVHLSVVYSLSTRQQATGSFNYLL